MKARLRELLHATPFSPSSPAWRMAVNIEAIIPILLAASNEQTQVVIEDEAGGMHYLPPLLMTSLERIAHGPNGSTVAA